MAANYWDSSQAKHWLFTQDELASMRAATQAKSPLHAKYELPDRRLIAIFMQQQLTKLARRLNLRQQVIATSQVYLTRFYLLVDIRRTNPYLLMTTALYLAAKMEECPIHIRFVLSEAARHWPELGHGSSTSSPSTLSSALASSSTTAGLLASVNATSPLTDTSRVGECEFHLISTLSAQMIVYHPYRTINTDLVSRLGLTPDEVALAGNIVNDSYACDVLLLHAPHVIAVTAVFLALVLRPSSSQTGMQGSGSSSSNSAHHTGVAAAAAVQQGLGIMAGAGGGGVGPAGAGLGSKGHHAKIMRLVDWMAGTQVDVTEIIHCVQEIICLYEVWEGFQERACREALGRFIRDLP